MSEEIKLEGLGIAPEVIEKIITMAAQDVDGVAGVCTGQSLTQRAQKAVSKQSARCIEVEVEPEGVAVDVHVEIEYGKPLHAVAVDVQEAVADAIKSQVGAEVASVDVFVDGVVFQA